MKELIPGYYIAKQSPWTQLTIVIVAVLFAALMFNPAGEWMDHVVLVGMPMLFAVYALFQLMMRSELRIDANERRYTWRPSSFPGSKTFSGDLDESTKGLQLTPKPCGSRRACISGWQVVVVFRTHLGDYPLGSWLDRDEAEAAFHEWSEKLRLPELNELGRPLKT